MPLYDWYLRPVPESPIDPPDDYYGVDEEEADRREEEADRDAMAREEAWERDREYRRYHARD